MNSKTIVTAMVAMILVIGMTGAAMADSTSMVFGGDGSYIANFDATGSGALGIYTTTADGYDQLNTVWENAQVTGYQEMDTGSVHSMDWTKVSRDVTVEGASMRTGALNGTIQTYTNNNDAILMSTAHIYDGYAVGDFVTLDQDVEIIDRCNREIVKGDTSITGYAYNDGAYLTGQVIAEYGDEYASVYLRVDDGRIDQMDVTNCVGEIRGPDGARAGSRWSDGITIAVSDDYAPSMVNGDLEGTLQFVTRGDHQVGDISTHDIAGASTTNYDWDVNGPTTTLVTTTFGDTGSYTGNVFSAHGYIYAVTP